MARKHSFAGANIERELRYLGIFHGKIVLFTLAIGLDRSFLCPAVFVLAYAHTDTACGVRVSRLQIGHKKLDEPDHKIKKIVDRVNNTFSH